MLFSGFWKAHDPVKACFDFNGKLEETRQGTTPAGNPFTELVIRNGADALCVCWWRDNGRLPAGIHTGGTVRAFITVAARCASSGRWFNYLNAEELSLVPAAAPAALPPKPSPRPSPAPFNADKPAPPRDPESWAAFRRQTLAQFNFRP